MRTIDPINANIENTIAIASAVVKGLLKLPKADMKKLYTINVFKHQHIYKLHLYTHKNSSLTTQI